MKFGKAVIVSFILGITFAGTLTFAAWATATWNDTNSWISNGSVISAQKIAENFEYLKREIYANTSTIQNNTTNINNISTGVSRPPVCTGSGKVLQWNGSVWSCATTGSVAGDVIAGCPLGYYSTCWGGATHGWTSGTCPTGSTYKYMGLIYDYSGESYGGFAGSFICLKN